MRPALSLFIIYSFILAVCIAEGDVCSLPPPSPIHKFSICTMVHNEGKYIEEWVAYHLLLKVSHMYIYNDQSDDNTLAILSPYIKQGYVTLIPWDKSKQTVDPNRVPVDPPYTRAQRFALADCVYNHANQSEWFGIWDVDEFVVFGDSFPGITDFIDSIKADLDNYVIPLTVYGSNGHETTPHGLVIENYVWRNNDTRFGFNEKTNKFSGKSIYSSACASPEVHFSNNLPSGCNRHYGWVQAEGSSNHLPVKMNHYATKSWEHFVEKMRKWNWGVNESDKAEFLERDSDFYDDSLLKYGPLIRGLETCMSQYL